MKHPEGFTLVELLVTISIIGILASITVVSVGSVRQIARDSKRLADIKQLQTAAELYFNSNNSYPLANGLDNAVTLGSANYSVLCNTAAGFVASIAACGVSDIYMTRVPANPMPSGTDYSYTPQQGDAGNANRPRQYQLTFTLETNMAGFAAGLHTATPAGVR